MCDEQQYAGAGVADVTIGGVPYPEGITGESEQAATTTADATEAAADSAGAEDSADAEGTDGTATEETAADGASTEGGSEAGSDAGAGSGDVADTVNGADGDTAAHSGGDVE